MIRQTGHSPAAVSPMMTRRDMLCRLGGGFGAVALTSVLSGGGLLKPLLAEASAMPSPLKGANHTLDPKAAHFPPRAKRVIFLFMNGGPSHVDTFDPKPALAKYEGQQPTGELFKKSKGSGFLPSPLKFEKCGRGGVDVSESFPNIKRVIDDCC